MSEDERFGRSVRRLREQREWSQGELAERLKRAGHDNFHATTVSRIEKGDRPVRLSEAVAIAETLGSNLVEMLLPSRIAQHAEDYSKALRDFELSRMEVLKAMATYLINRRRLRFYAEQVTRSVEDRDLKMNPVESEHLVVNLRKGADLLDESLGTIVGLAEKTDRATRYKPSADEA